MNSETAEQGSHESDTDLVSRYLTGQIDALERLVKRHEGTLYGYIRQWTEGAAEADDIFQETWFKAIRRLHRYRDGNFVAWLARIARNLTIDRSRKKKPLLSLDAISTEQPDIDPPDVSDGTGLLNSMEADELGKRIWKAVGTLPVLQREVFTLRMKMDLSFKEIAGMQGVSINTVLGRMHYAVARLRQHLQTDYQQLGR